MKRAGEKARPTTSPRRGRPLNQALDAAILRAALDAIAESGYEALRIEQVARRIGAGKSSVYRRWPTKEALVVAAIRWYLAERAALAANTSSSASSLREDLIRHVRAVVALLTRQHVAILSGLFQAMRTNDHLASMVRRELVHAETTALSAVLQRAVERGEIARLPHSSALLHVTAGVVFTRLFVLDQPVDEALAIGLVDDVLIPSIRHAAGAGVRQ
jgi:AcrR family transcriptional regulator